MNADGSGARRLTRTRGVRHRRRVLARRAEGPVSTARAPGGHRGDVVVVNGNSSGRRNLTRHPALDAPGSWSPDSPRSRASTVESRRQQRALRHELERERAAHPCSHNPSLRGFAGAFSPDGRRIALGTNREGNWEIYVAERRWERLRGNLTARSPRDRRTREGVIDGRWTAAEEKVAVFIRASHGRNAADLRDERGRQRPAEADAHRPQSEFTPGAARLTDARLRLGASPSTPRWAFFVMNADGSGVRKVNWALPRRR